MSGQSAEVFATKHGLSPSTLRWWDSQLRTHHEPAALAVREVVVAPATVVSAPVELELGAMRLRFEVGTEPAYVAAVARALAESARP